MELSRGCKLDIGVRQSGDSSRWLRRKDFLVVPRNGRSFRREKLRRRYGRLLKLTYVRFDNGKLGRDVPTGRLLTRRVEELSTCHEIREIFSR